MAGIPNKELTIARIYTASLYMWACLCTTLVSVLMYVIGYATVFWGIVNYAPDFKTTRTYLGLWQNCTTGLPCYFISSLTLSHVMRAVQAFATLSLVALLFSLLMCMSYIFFPWVKRQRSIGLILTGSHAAATLLLLITLSVFGARWRDGLQPHTGRIGYSAGLVIISLVMELFSTTLAAIDVIVIPRFSGPPLPVQYEEHSEYPKDFVDMVPPSGDT